MQLSMALQLYSIREELEKDFKGIIKQVKEQGYEGVELAGKYGFSAQEMKCLLAEIGLKPISAHVSIDDFLEDLEGNVAYYYEVGCGYIVVPYAEEKHRYGGEQYEELLTLIPQIIKEANKFGMVVLYHNHDFEFKKTERGTYPLDELFASMEGLMMELDSCWTAASGIDPITYIKQYENRCPIVHLKDYVMEDGVKFRPLGEGLQNIPGIIKGGLASGVQWFVAEQDDHYEQNPLENTKKSIEYIKGVE